jgi:UDP:flavonoid glycosyltransferase YjiC (YdhE family)
VGCPRTFPRSKHLYRSYERAFGAYSANQEIGVATQHNIFASSQNTAEHSKTSVKPIRSEKIKQWRRDRPRSDALVLRAAPASIVEYRFKNSLALSASSMPPLGFQCVTHRMNIPHEHASYMNFTLHNEQNRQQGNVRRPHTGKPVLLMFMCSDDNYSHAIPFRKGRGRNQSVSWAIQPVLPS